MEFDGRQMERYFVEMARKNPEVLARQFALLPQQLVRQVKKDWTSNWRTRNRGHDTGRLKASVVGENVRFAGDEYESGVTARTEYAAVHEFGFDGEVNIRAHTRFVRGNAVSVRSHSRHMSVTEKRYLRNPLPEGVKLWLKGFGRAWREMMKHA